MNRRIIVPLSGKRYTYGTELLLNGGFETAGAFMAPIERKAEEVVVLTFWERVWAWLVALWASVKATVKNAAIAVRGWTVKQWNKFIFIVKKSWENTKQKYEEIKQWLRK